VGSQSSEYEDANNVEITTPGLGLPKPGLFMMTGMTGIGASRPLLRRIPAIVSFLNPQPALSLVGGNRSSCPTAGRC
jgi:hypothetical protein